MNKRYDLIIFDWDGTLIDSVGRIVSSMRAAAVDAQLPVPSESAVRGIIGLSLEEVYARLFPGAPEEHLELLRIEYRKQFIEVDTTPSPLFDGARDVVEQLRHDGYRLAVATGKARHGLVRAWTEVGLQDHFHASRCSDEALGKPHPQMVLDLLKETGVHPQRALMVGDTSFDMEMARRAGIDRVAATYGAHELHELVPHAPLMQLDSIRQLTPWLDSFR